MNGLSLRISTGGVGKDAKSNNESKLETFIFPEWFSDRFSSMDNIERLLEASNINQQLEYVRNVSKTIDSIGKDVSKLTDYISLLVNMFYHLPAKHPLKNTASRILSSKKNHLTLVEDCLSKEVANCISNLTEIEELNEINNINTILNGFFENFTPGVGAVRKSTKTILPFLDDTLNSYVAFIRNNSLKLSPTEKLELYTYIHNLNRLLLTLLQKCEVNLNSVDSVDVWDNLSTFSMCLIRHEDLPIDTKILSAMIFISISQLRFGLNTWKYIVEIIFNVGDHSDHMVHENVADLKTPLEVLCVCSSLLNIISTDDIRSEIINNQPVLVFISQKLFELSEKMSVDTTIIIGVARAMLSASRLLFKVTDDANIVVNVTKIVLSFIWSHLEYYVDSVRHLSTQILVNIVKVSVQLENQGNESLSNEVFSSVMLLPSDRHSKYKGLATLSSEYGCKHLLVKYPNIVPDLLKAINNTTIPANVTVAFETMMSEHNKEVSMDVLFETWVVPILKTMMTYENNDESVMSMNILQDILSKAIRLNSSLVSLMIPYISNDKDYDTMSYGQLKCILVCLHVARKLGSLDQDANETKGKYKSIIDYEVLQRATFHECSEIRLMCLHLIVDTRKTTELYNEEEFNLLKSFLHYNVNVQSPSVRQKILALTKKLLKRWKDSFDVLSRNLENHKNKSLKMLQLEIASSPQSESDHRIVEQLTHAKGLYVDFVENLWSWCLENVVPGANFTRRNIILQILVWCQECVKSNGVKFSWSKNATKSLIEYFDDSYECNKQLVVNLLSYCPAEHLQFDNAEWMKMFLNESIALASSVKPTDCSTAAYQLLLLLFFPKQFQHVLCKSVAEDSELCFDCHFHTIQLLVKALSTEMKVAESSILFASSSGPMYGLLHCIRHVLNQVDYSEISKNSQWASLIYQLVQMSFEVNRIVSPIVNNSSPEGHLPMDFNAGSSHVEGNGVIMEDGKRVTAQMVLLCAWRSVKEVSLLLGDVAYNVDVVDDTLGEESLSTSLILEIGEHFTTLLSETKHRGAFEQAYLGFSKLCLRLWKSNQEALHRLPHTWLEELINAISGDSKNSKLCATRRSAGVPFMVQALVTTELQVSGKPQSFHKCITTLLRLATFNDDETNRNSVETRTHCLNILRALYRHTSLGEHVNPYVAEGLMTAITGFDGSTWAERNSSTLLFSSLMTRIFGVQRSKDSEDLCIRNRMTGRIFFLRYPQLYDFILRHLVEVAKCIDSKDFLKPSLYPILLLLARLYPSSLEGTDSNLKLIVYIPYLLECAKCCVLKTRQLAAKAMVPLVSHDRYFPHVLSLFEILADNQIKTNYCHGILLQLIRLLQNKPENCDASNQFLRDLVLCLDKTKWILTNIYKEKPCFITAESYLQVVHSCILRFDLTNVDSKYFDELNKYLTCPNDCSLKMHFGKEKFFTSCLHLLVQLAFQKRDSDKIFYILDEYTKSSVYELQFVALNYILCLQNESCMTTVCELFEIGDTEMKFVCNLSTEIKNNILKRLHAANKELKLKKHWSDNPHCIRKQLMSITCDRYLSESYCNLDSSHAMSDDDRLVYFLRQTVSEYHQINRFVHLRLINNHFKDIHCSSVYDHHSAMAVLHLSRHMFESWTSCNNSLALNVECVRFFKNHWRMFSWHADIDDKERVYSTILQWSSLLQLLDDEEEPVRKGAAEVVSEIIANQVTVEGCRHFVCENKAKELLLQRIYDFCSKISQDFTTFVLIILTLLNGDTSDTNYSNDEEHQVFDKEVTTYQERVINRKQITEKISEHLEDKFVNKNSHERLNYLMALLQEQSKEMWVNDGDIHGGNFKNHYTFWEKLESDSSSENFSINMNKITTFFSELIAVNE